MMIVTTHGQILNYSTYARSLDLSTPTIKTDLHFLTNSFLVDLLPPWHKTIKKRLVKSPKIYIKVLECRTIWRELQHTMRLSAML